MPGVFSKDARPLRPGAYFDWATLQPDHILPNIGSVVFLPFIHSWGPTNTVVQLGSYSEFIQAFGPDTTTAGYRAVKHCFLGEGLPGRGGAGVVLAYRIATSTAAAAALTLQNTSDAPALTLTAIYTGTYGEQLSATTQTNSRDESRKDLVILLADTIVETFTYDPTDIDGLLAEVNAQSKWVVASASTTGTALATVTDQPLIGANDGTSDIASGDWTSMLDVAEAARFGIFAPYEMIDTGIKVSIVAWAKALNLNGKRFFTIFGGDITDAVSDAVTRSAASNNENFINLGVGGVVDSELGILSTSKLVPRVAGILAQRGEDKSLTYARFTGLTAYEFPTESEILQGFTGGVVTLSQDSHPDAPVRIEKGLTTYTTTTDATKPYLIYRNPKFIRTMHGIESDLTEWAAFNAIGELQVNDQTRAYVVGYAHDVIKARADRGIVQQGYTVAVDPNPPPSDFDEFVALVYGIAFGRSVEQIFNLVYVS